MPSLQDVALVFLNMGVSFVSLFPLEALQPSFTEGDLLWVLSFCSIQHHPYQSFTYCHFWTWIHIFINELEVVVSMLMSLLFIYLFIFCQREFGNSAWWYKKWERRLHISRAQFWEHPQGNFRQDGVWFACHDLIKSVVIISYQLVCTCVSFLMQYLALCTALCPRMYSDEELLLMLTVVCRVSLETHLQLLPTGDLSCLLQHLLNNMTDWDMQVRHCTRTRSVLT